MIETLARYRPGIETAINSLRPRFADLLHGINPWAPDLTDRLLAFAASGKLIRGSLAVASAELFGGTADSEVLQLAAALELVQSFLLVHDDIMDQDAIRRGKPALHEQYRRQGDDGGFSDPARFGESMAICGGDVAMLMALDVIASLARSPSTALRLTSLVAREISRVGVAQMADVANGHTPEAAGEQEIVNVYRFKTGRYTFSLPLMAGAICAGADQRIVEGLSEWGEIEGVIFQIRDDHLGVMGETERIGKPSGSDVAADKQTLHRLEFLSRIAGTEWEGLARWFGDDSITAEALALVQTAMRESGALDALQARIAALREEAAGILDALGLTQVQREALDAIDEFNATRLV